MPSGVVPYVGILGALASTSVPLSLTPVVLQFTSTRGTPFVLAGLGFLGGIAAYLTKYWRREFYLIAIPFALATWRHRPGHYRTGIY
ncbi:hypothetical protein C2R22_11885 [Salinigranum rubrum]|uniref:Uncharacterized protein n=1 Tax=Salinigranum rubrum TaxID=755307 RepID=A0A2I8VK00_9EURY|nr:hypothetical protein [Salinigranum rubrum]AUV82256.1 hypothetical protein C2R22_11885 [Salinigranum rubrum]